MKIEITITLTGNNIRSILNSIERIYATFKTEQAQQLEITCNWAEFITPTAWE